MQAVWRRLGHQCIKQSTNVSTVQTASAMLEKKNLGRIFEIISPFSLKSLYLFNGVENHRLGRVTGCTGGGSGVSGISTGTEVFDTTRFLGRYSVQQLAKMGSQVPFSKFQDSHHHIMGGGQVFPVKSNHRDEKSSKAIMTKANVIDLIGRGYKSKDYNSEISHMAEEVARFRRNAARHLTTNSLEPNVGHSLVKSEYPLSAHTLVKILKGKGIPSKQAEAIISTISSLSHERVKNISLVMHNEMENGFKTCKIEFSKSNIEVNDFEACRYLLREFNQMHDHIEIGIELRSNIDSIQGEECIKSMHEGGFYAIWSSRRRPDKFTECIKGEECNKSVHEGGVKHAKFSEVELLKQMMAEDAAGIKRSIREQLFYVPIFFLAVIVLSIELALVMVGYKL